MRISLKMLPLPTKMNHVATLQYGALSSPNSEDDFSVILVAYSAGQINVVKGGVIKTATHATFYDVFLAIRVCSFVKNLVRRQ